MDDKTKKEIQTIFDDLKAEMGLASLSTPRT